MTNAGKYALIDQYRGFVILFAGRDPAEFFHLNKRRDPQNTSREQK